jgi:hypothetical protein
MSEPTTAVLDVEAIETADEFNPRTDFDEGALAGLEASIRQSGLVTALTVRPNGEDKFTLIDGQIHVDLVGRIDSKNGGIRTTFATVPDAPVSKFVLKMPGGRKSLLENSTNICHGKHAATVTMDGQNGKIHDLRPRVRAKCGKRSRQR